MRCYAWFAVVLSAQQVLSSDCCGMPPVCDQVMGKSKVLVKVHPEGKYVVDIDKDIDIADLTPGVCCQVDFCGVMQTLLGTQSSVLEGFQGFSSSKHCP